MHAATGCLLAVALLASTGCTVGAYGAPRYGDTRHADGRAAFDRGYRDGFASGERDARSGYRYDHRRDRLYRDGVYGHDPRAGSRGEYRRLYREGFESGYREGYARFGRYDDRRGRGRGPYGSGAYGVGAAARERGFAEGYDKGREDGRDRDRFDPRRHKWYREGDRGYRREYGPRDAYARVYREAFVQGYERGYREARSRY